MPEDLTAAEQAAAEALAPSIGDEYSPYEIADTARAVVAAVRGPLAEETSLQLGRDCLRDGLEPFLQRLIGPENTARMLAVHSAQVLDEHQSELSLALEDEEFAEAAQIVIRDEHIEGVKRVLLEMESRSALYRRAARQSGEGQH